MWVARTQYILQDTSDWGFEDNDFDDAYIAEWVHIPVLFMKIIIDPKPLAILLFQIE